MSIKNLLLTVLLAALTTASTGCGESWINDTLQQDNQSQTPPDDNGGGDDGSGTDDPPPNNEPGPNPPEPEPDIFPDSWQAAWSAGRPQDMQRKAWTDHLWTETLRLAVPSLVATPKDLQSYCPNWPNLNTKDRRAFLVVLLSIMTRYESNFNPATQYRENFNDSQGRPVISRGLLQLSVESSRAYGCDVTETTLHDPFINLSCGLRILNRWIERDQYFGTSLREPQGNRHLGGARYWAVLRDTLNIKPNIINYLRTQTPCQIQN